MKRVFFFGGSFDPPHRGHLGVAQGALASNRADTILWVPAFDPPHKLQQKRAAYSDRLNLVKLLIAGLQGHEASDWEWRLRLSPSYSLDVLRELKKVRPELCGMLIGADSLLELHTWSRPRELMAEFELLTYPRPGCAITPEQLAQRHWSKSEIDRLMQTVIPGEFFPESSTQLRHAPELEMPQLAAYIRRHKLYSSILPERNPAKSSVK